MAGSIGESFITIRAETSGFTPELQAAIDAAISATEASAQPIDVAAQLDEAAAGAVAAETQAAADAAEAGTEPVDVAAQLAADAAGAVATETQAAVDAAQDGASPVGIEAALDAEGISAEVGGAVDAATAGADPVTVALALDDTGTAAEVADTIADAESQGPIEIALEVDDSGATSALDTFSDAATGAGQSAGVFAGEAAEAGDALGAVSNVATTTATALTLGAGGFDAIKNKALGATGQFGAVTRAINPMTAGFAAAAGGVILAVNAFTDLAERVRDFSAVTGASLEQSSRIVEVFGDLGFNVDAVEKAFFLLNKNIGTGKDTLTDFGIEVVKSKDGNVNYIKTLLNVATAYQTAGSDAQKTELLFRTFGKAGAELAPILGQNADALRAMFAEVSDAKIINEQDIADAQELRLALDTVSDVVSELALTFAREALPSVVALVDAMGGLLKALGPPLQFALKAAAVGLEALALVIEPIVTIITGVLNPIDTLKAAVHGLGDEVNIATEVLAGVDPTLKLVGGALVDAGDAAKNTKVDTVALKEATAGLNVTLDDLPDAFELSQQAADDFSDALARTLGITLNLQEANDNYEAALDDLRKTLKDNGDSFDSHTQKGRENRQALRDVVEAADEQRDALIRSTDATESDTDSKRILIDKLKDAAAEFPNLRGRIQNYIDTVKDTPAEKVTRFIADTSSANFSIGALIGLINSIPDVVGINVSGGGGSSSSGGGGGGGGGEGGSSSGRRDRAVVNNVTINEVAGDPRATAAAVAQRLGTEATR